jgi:hypothetical protein
MRLIVTLLTQTQIATSKIIRTIAGFYLRLTIIQIQIVIQRFMTLIIIITHIHIVVMIRKTQAPITQLLLMLQVNIYQITHTLQDQNL